MIESTALRALGILRGEPLVRLMSRLRTGDPVLEDDLREMERAAAMLAFTAPAVELPPDLKRRVLSRAGADGDYFLHERDSEWESTSMTGTHLRRLFIDSRGGRETRLVKLSPAAASSDLASLAGPSFYVLSGDLAVDGGHLEMGDYFDAGAAPHAGRTEQGCILFTVLAPSGSNGKHRPRVLVRAAQGDWNPAEGGVTVKELGVDRDRGIAMRLVRMDAGSRWSERSHEASEEMFLVRGDCQCRGTHLHPGDFVRSGPGVERPPTTSATGCKLIIVSQMRESAE